MKKLLLPVLVTLVFLSCQKSIEKFQSPKGITSFGFFNGEDTIPLNISDSTIEGIKQDTGSKANMVAVFTFKGKKVTVDGKLQTSGVTANDFSKPVIYTVESMQGSLKSYKVILSSFTGLPILYLTMAGPVVDKENYVKGTFRLNGNYQFEDVSATIQMRGRGNSTWPMPKKPYKIKFDSKTSVMGMPADKEWALLANFFDLSLLRNDVGFELAERLQMAWTPKRRFTEVFLDGNYIGNYLLTETVKTATERLNIKLMDGKNAADTSGGYLLEADWALDAKQTFISNWGFHYSLQEPETVTGTQLSYMKRQVETIEDSVFFLNERGMEKWIDVDSWIKWTIVNEVMRNRDATLYSSCYFYQGANQKLFMGPVWDMDLSSGSYYGSEPTGWYVNTGSILGEAYKNNSSYRERFKQLWNANKEKISSITGYMDNKYRYLQLSQAENYRKWPYLSSPVFDGEYASGSYETEVNRFKKFLVDRINWIDREVNK